MCQQYRVRQGTYWGAVVWYVEDWAGTKYAQADTEAEARREADRLNACHEAQPDGWSGR